MEKEMRTITIGNLELRSIRRRQISSLHAEVTAEETAEAGKARRGGDQKRFRYHFQAISPKGFPVQFLQ
ncbi:hypothetical protein SDJN02_09168, partial [Cucurbita argyrosperma subsp. argyrosperma]